MKKTNRTNKTNMTVTWPTNTFTIKDLKAVNPDFVEITLRDKTKKAINRGEVMELGTLHNGLGRPTNVMAMAPVTDSHIQEAKTKGVVLKSQYAPSEASVSVNVVTINAKEQSTESVTTADSIVTESASEKATA